MKYFVPIYFLLHTLSLHGQSRKTLKKNIDVLTSKYEVLNRRYATLEKSNNKIIAAFNELDQKYNILDIKYIELKKKYDQCLEEDSSDLGRPENFAKSMFNLIKHNNKNKLSEFLVNFDDYTNYFPEEAQQKLKKRANRDSISITKILNEYNIESLQDFERVYYEGINYGINWNDAVYAKSKIKVQYREKINLYEIEYSIYFTYAEREFYFEMEGLIINDKPKVGRFSKLIDIKAQELLKEQKERLKIQRKKELEDERKKQPYRPLRLFIGKSTWTYYKDRKSTFADFDIKVTNNTQFYVKSVKFRISISTDSQGKVFSRIYDRNVELLPSEIKQLRIPDLSNFYLGEDVTTHLEKWNITCELLEAYPKHNQ